jgi:hypothetical protein
LKLRINDITFSEPKGLNPDEYVVFLDGELEINWIEADDKEGYIKRYYTDSKNEIIIDMDCEPIVETKFGNVYFKEIYEVL